MSRASRQTLILLGLVALVSLLLAWSAGRRDEAGVAATPLLALAPESVREIERVCAGCAPLRLERRAGRWRIVAPWSLPADPVAVARLLEIAGQPVLRRLDAGAVDPVALGLAPPLATLRLDQHRLAFGTTDAIDNRRYVHVGGDAVLVADRFGSWLLAGPERFASARPLAGVRAPAAPARGGWTAEQIAILRGARALDVGRHAHAPPRDAPVVVDAHGGSHRYWWAADPPDTLLRESPPLAYALASDVAQALRAAGGP